MGVPAKKKWTKPDYRKLVEEMLRLYPLYKKSLESGLGGGLFPSLTPSYDLKVVGGKRESTTEKYAIKRAERQELVKLVEYALSFLDDEEREVIEATYFIINRPRIYIVFQELNMSERSYHRIKKRAISKIALVLGLI